MASSLPAQAQNGRFQRELEETRAHMAAVRAPVPPHISSHKLATGLGLENLHDILGDNPGDSSTASAVKDSGYAYDDRFAATDPGCSVSGIGVRSECGHCEAGGCQKVGDGQAL